MRNLYQNGLINSLLVLLLERTLQEDVRNADVFEGDLVDGPQIGVYLLTEVDLSNPGAWAGEARENFSLWLDIWVYEGGAIKVEVREPPPPGGRGAQQYRERYEKQGEVDVKSTYEASRARSLLIKELIFLLMEEGS